MKWSETEKFTWDELSNFTWDEIKLEAEELIQKLHDDNRVMPVSAIEKLNEICAPLPEDAPKVKEGMTRAEICMFLTLMITYMTNLPEISKKWIPIIQAIIEFVADFLKQ